MNTKQYPSQDFFKNLFTADFEFGQLTRNFTTGTRAKKGHIVKANFNGSSMQVMIYKKQYCLHRILWIMAYGDIDTDVYLDHINRNPKDNSLSNLRIATPSQNAVNAIYDKGKNGHGVGLINIVVRNVNYCYYQAHVTCNGKQYTRKFNIKKYSNALEMAQQWHFKKHVELFGEFSPYFKQ